MAWITWGWLPEIKLPAVLMRRERGLACGGGKIAGFPVLERLLVAMGNVGGGVTGSGSVDADGGERREILWTRVFQGSGCACQVVVVSSHHGRRSL